MDRREFIKRSAGAVAATTLVGCNNNSQQVNKSTGQQVNKTRATGMAKAKDRRNPHALRGARFKAVFLASERIGACR